MGIPAFGWRAPLLWFALAPIWFGHVKLGCSKGRSLECISENVS